MEKVDCNQDTVVFLVSMNFGYFIQDIEPLTSTSSNLSASFADSASATIAGGGGPINKSSTSASLKVQYIHNTSRGEIIRWLKMHKSLNIFIHDKQASENYMRRINN